MSEEVIWRGRPSQILNLGPFLLALLALAAIGVGGAFFPPLWIAAVVPLGWAIWRFLVVRCRVYEVTDQRLRMYSGVLNQRIDELELYRVKDSVIERPLWLRLFGLAVVVLETSDRSHPVVEIEAVPGSVEIRDTLRKQVEFWRDRKRVREVDFEEGGDMEGDDGLFES